MSGPIDRMLATLAPQEIKVIHSRFYSNATLTETGMKLGGKSAERVRQIEAKALRKLRSPLRIRNLEGLIKWND